MPRRVLRALLLVSCVCSLTCTFFGATAYTPAEARTARYFESIRNNPGLLLAFLREMPKGADLHNHLSGAIYAESLIEWAAEANTCVDPKTLQLTPQPCRGMSATVPAKSAFTDPILYRNMIDAFSMRDWTHSGQSGHDHFFDTFDKFGPATHGNTGKMLAETAERAASQHEVYQELMLTPLGAAFNEMVQKTPWTDDLVEMQKLLLENGMDKTVAEARQQLDTAELVRNERLHCGTAQPDAGCRIPQRYLFQVLRGLPRNVVFAQMIVGFELSGADPRFVGLNLVMPEDYYVPMHDFPVHMRMLQYLHGVYPRVHITLHAGELSQGMVPPEGREFHIRDSVEKAHAERIGHGVDLMSETAPLELLREMAERNVMVEICLTSNDVILGVTGNRHPLHQYMRAGVPVALATDDEGVARSDMTLEYLRGAEDQGLTYPQLKNMARTSLEHAFLPGASLWRDARAFSIVKDCVTQRTEAKSPTSRCQNFLESSEKARLQWELENEFREFESSNRTATGGSSRAAARSSASGDDSPQRGTAPPIPDQTH